MDDWPTPDLERLAPDVDTAAARAAFDRRRRARRRNRRIGGGLAALVVVAGVAFGVSRIDSDDSTPVEVAGGSDETTTTSAPAATTSVPTGAPAELGWKTFEVDGAEVLARSALVELPQEASVVEFAVTLIDSGEGPELCLGGVAESLPPQCSGPVVDGLTLGEWSQEAAGVRWGERNAVVSWPPVDGRVALLSEAPYVPPVSPPEVRELPIDEDAVDEANEALVPELKELMGTDGPPYAVEMHALSDRVEIQVAVADLDTVRDLIEAVGDPTLLRVTSIGAVLDGTPAVPPPTTTTTPVTTVVPATTTTTLLPPTTTPPPTTVPPPATTVPAPTRVLVSQHQTGCCYFEGSIGLLEILDAAGNRIGPITRAGEATGDIESLRSSFDPVMVDDHGTYTISVWQLPGEGPGPSMEYADWEASAAQGGQRPDLCTGTFELTGADLVLEAVWAPGDGCEFLSG